MVSLAGGSRFQIAGPSAAFVLLSAEWAGRYGASGLAAAGLMTGLFLVFFGLTKIADAVKLLPLPVIIGLLNGITIVLTARQLEFLLGFSLRSPPQDFPMLVQQLAGGHAAVDPWAVGLAAFCLGLLALCRRMRWMAPGSLVVLLLVSSAAAWLRLPVQTVGSRVLHWSEGTGIGPGLVLRSGLWMELLIPALTCAVVVSLESLLSASSADSLRASKHDTRIEITGQGVANVISGLLGGMIVSGAPVRTSLNAKLSGATPIAGFIRAAVLLTIAVFAQGLVRAIPLALIGAVLLELSLSAGGWSEVSEILRRDSADRLTWAAVLVLTIIGGIPMAVLAALLLSVVYYVRRLRSDASIHRAVNAKPISDQPPGFPLAFIVSSLPELQRLTGNRDSNPKRPGEYSPIILLNGRSLADSELNALHTAAEALSRSGRLLVIYEPSRAGWNLRSHNKLAQSLHSRNILPTLPAAIFRAHELRDRFFGLAERFPE